MYYKILNKDSDVYKKFFELRIREKNIEKENKQAIKDKSGLDFESFLGYSGQQNFGRVTEYTGFKFTEPEKVDLKIWQRHKTHSEIFIPNRKTKLGREMAKFISNGLKGSRFDIPFEILGLEHPSKFTFPFVEIYDDIILLYLDENVEPNDVNVIEITKTEFQKIRDDYYERNK